MLTTEDSRINEADGGILWKGPCFKVDTYISTLTQLKCDKTNIVAFTNNKSVDFCNISAASSPGCGSTCDHEEYMGGTTVGKQQRMAHVSSLVILFWPSSQQGATILGSSYLPL